MAYNKLSKSGDLFYRLFRKFLAMKYRSQRATRNFVKMADKCTWEEQF